MIIKFQPWQVSIHDNKYNITIEAFETSSLVKLLEIIIDNKMLLSIKCAASSYKKLRNSKTRISVIFDS